MTDTSDLSQEQKQRLAEWARSRAFGKVMECCAYVALRFLPRRHFDLRGWRLKLDDARLDLGEPCPCMVIHDGVLRAASPFLPPESVAQGLANSMAGLEVERLHKQLDRVSFQYAECQQELLEERESHVQTWQIAQRQIGEFKDKLEASQVKWAVADDDSIKWRMRWLDTQTRFEKALSFAVIFFLAIIYLVWRLVQVQS